MGSYVMAGKQWTVWTALSTGMDHHCDSLRGPVLNLGSSHVMALYRLIHAGMRRRNDEVERRSVVFVRPRSDRNVSRLVLYPCEVVLFSNGSVVCYVSSYVFDCVSTVGDSWAGGSLWYVVRIGARPLQVVQL